MARPDHRQRRPGEGATGQLFDLFILLANPSTTDAEVEARYLLFSGEVVTKTYRVAANSRFNVPVGIDFPVTAGKRFGAVVESVGADPARIVVERAVYEDDEGVWWAAGSNALATLVR